MHDLLASLDVTEERNWKSKNTSMYVIINMLKYMFPHKSKELKGFNV